MSVEYEKLRFIDCIKPVLTSGKHTVEVTQSITEPSTESFQAEEDFYVSSRAYTIDANEIFSVSPTENECGDFSMLIPFITIENKTFPWIFYNDINGRPVPWVTLIVISSEEEAEEKDIAVSELFNTPSDIYFPDRSSLPSIVIEKEEELCHIADIPIELYKAIMPSFKDMAYLTHVKRVCLSETANEIAAKEGDFSVIMANRFIPTGESERLKSTVHLVSHLGFKENIPEHYNKVRLVSLHRWNVYSVKDDSQAFSRLIDSLSRNTGIMGYDLQNEVLKQCYVPKKHLTRSGEMTYSLYRSPLIPYANQEIDMSSKFTADGHLIYDPQKGILDTSYASAFQLGRLISLNRKTDSKRIVTWRKNRKQKAHRKLLDMNIQRVNVAEVCKEMIREMK